MFFKKDDSFLDESFDQEIDGSGIIDQDALMENMLVDEMNRMSDAEFEAYTESSEFNNLVEAGVLGRRSLVKMNRKDDLRRRIHLASIQMAREQGDADWEALRKNRINERRLLKKIYTKYQNRVRRNAMQSQKRLIKLTPDAFNFNKINR
jgi:hypothetical protein|nr:MAG TPA: hypothetical protein [Caudoviricetes sp.]